MPLRVVKNVMCSCITKDNS